MAHPGFVDMTGKTVAGAKVLMRSRNGMTGNSKGNAFWLVRRPCGHEEEAQGINLRDAEKDGRKPLCKACRARKS